MIVYESNKHWLNDITHLFRSWTMTKIMRSVGSIGVFTALVCVLELEVFNMESFSFSTSVFSLLGIVLSILLVFRTNTSYDRWWEGRQLWGALVNNSRNLAITAHSTIPLEDHKTRHRISALIANFAIALKEHLRGGVKIEELIFLTEEDKVNYPKKQHLPNYISAQIHQLVEHQYREKIITGEDILNYKPHMQALMDIAGACERIKKTPIPFSYNVYLKVFITAYAILMPIAMAPEMGYWAIPAVMFVFFAFIGVEMMAEEIEDPFGLDCNDLPTGDIAHTIKNNVFEILDHAHIHAEAEQQLYAKIF
jgi:ion channel-forming bestrophin family protein